MRITYDPLKRDATMRERGLGFEDAAQVFAGLTFDFADERFDYGETRMITVGHLVGRMVIVVRTPRGRARHLISMRKANDREQALYRQRLEEGR